MVDLSVHLLMLGFSTHMRPRIVPPHLPLHMLAKKGKKRSYEQQIREIEHASFIPAVFATTGGMGRHATSLYKHIASLLSETAEPYNTVMAWLRCRMSFALLRSSIMYIAALVVCGLHQIICIPPQHLLLRRLLFIEH